jgi:hypothetical protein
MEDVWAVLEVVREQCWLNEVLDGVEWGVVEEGEMEAAEATEDDLQAILAGSYMHPPFPFPSDITL